MDKWDYIFKTFEEDVLETRLIQMGSFGYELVQVDRIKDTNQWCVFLKKKLNSE